MGSPTTNPKILYRNSRLLRMVFLQLHRQQRADLFCDVVLQAEGEAVPAHCCILSACSPFFTERLEREMPPKGGHKVVLELRGLKIGPLRKLVDFLYTSEMEVSREEAQDVLAAARQLQVSELESLQLEGGKLVKKALGRRLNRECLHLSSPISIPEESLIQSPPASGRSTLTSLLLARKQHTAVQFPCTKGISSSSNSIQKETIQEKPAMLNEDKHQKPEDSAALAEFVKTKAKRRLANTVTNILGSEEIDSLHTEQGKPRDKQTMAGFQESKKIKLSRPKLSSLHFPNLCTTEDHNIVSSKTSKSFRRLWRRKSLPVKDEAKGVGVISHLHGFLSPPLLPKATKVRKRSSSEPAPSKNPPQEAGQVGRVKLRKIINGSCWEVVQEPSAAQPKRAADSVCALIEEATLPQCRHPEQEVTVTQQYATSTKLPLKAESSSIVNLVEGAGIGGNSNKLLMIDQLAKSEQYDNLASAGHMLLADDVASRESQDTTGQEDMPVTDPAPKASASRGNAGDEKKHWCSAEVSVCSQFVKEGKCLLQEKQGCGASKIIEGTLGLTSGVSFLDPVHGCLPLATSPSSNDCIPLCSLTSLQQGSWTTHCQLENGAIKFAAPLPCLENQRLPSCGAATSNAETKPQTQMLLRSPLQHHLDCKLPPHLAILEEDEIDVGGIEEFFLNMECVRPDPSPVSENEVDVVNW